MTQREIERAKLFARSAEFALRLKGGKKMAETFARRGIALAGDAWPDVQRDCHTSGATSSDATSKGK